MRYWVVRVDLTDEFEYKITDLDALMALVWELTEVYGVKRPKVWGDEDGFVWIDYGSKYAYVKYENYQTEG